MPLSSVYQDTSAIEGSVYTLRYVGAPVPKYEMPEGEMPADAAYQLISDELALDSNPRLNLASFVTTWMEPQAEKLFMDTLNKNAVNVEEYPQTTEIQNRCVNMIARLFNAPTAESSTESPGVGTSCVGSSEAIMLAGLAMKWRWREARKAKGLPTDKPNLVMASTVQVCWDKLVKYFDIEPKFVNITDKCLLGKPEELVAAVDENTIGVVGILGSTYTGGFEDIKKINELLTAKNAEMGLDVGIHVDGASGGFVAPFLFPDLEWDFRLPLVRSINVSGHKYGLVHPGVGWVIWRAAEYLPDDLIFHLNYLGADQPSFTLNFSKGSSQFIAQYYQLIRLGKSGYTKIITHCAEVARYLADQLVATGRFTLLSDFTSLPLVACNLKDRSVPYDEFAISDKLRMRGWFVPAYTMAPNAGHIKLIRMVIREGFTRDMADMLLRDFEFAFAELDREVKAHAPAEAVDLNAHLETAVPDSKKRKVEMTELLNPRPKFTLARAVHWKVLASRARKQLKSKHGGIC